VKVLKPNSRKRADFELSNGALVELKKGTDINGLPVIASVTIFFGEHFSNPTQKGLPAGGITQKMLREIDFSLAIKNAFSKNENDDLLTDREKKLLISEVESGFTRAGRTPTPLISYAALARLYIDACKTNPRNPTQYLTELFEIQPPAMNGRLSKAKELGLLTFQNSNRPSGKAGAEMSDICETFVVQILKTKR
jgi:hypothetical protein